MLNRCCLTAPLDWVLPTKARKILDTTPKIETSKKEMLLESLAFGTSNHREEFPQLYTKFCKDTKQVLATHGIHYIDINSHSEFSENPKTLFCDVVHTNKTGNMVFAEIINSSLKKLKKGDCKSFIH